MTPHADLVSSLSRRLDRAALDQLRTVAATQATLIDALQQQVHDLQLELHRMEEVADSWREDAEHLAAASGHPVGLLATGHLALMSGQQVAA